MSDRLIHATAVVSSLARIGANVRIGAFTIIHDNVHIADGVEIGSHCEIGIPSLRAKEDYLYIGENSLIRSHSVFYRGSYFSSGLVTGHHVVVRENVRAGDRFQVGTASEIQGDCCVGDSVRLQSNVFVSQKTVIGSYVWLLPNVVLTNDPHPPSNCEVGVIIEDFAVLASMAVVLPGLRIGAGALVAANSTVTSDVLPDTVVAGSPAKLMCSTFDIRLRDGTNQPAYPWRRHFHRGYPDAVVEKWLAEFS